ncbi:MAG TPA: PQQ-binding-like beta-propeller repeat protein [Micromonosporaceae bacterium]|nr:PQQ-binding-like beta-propeller repeat protein [Micromonosporaceae bacterium]
MRHGEVRWSVERSNQNGGELVALRDHRCLISDQFTLTAARPPGRVDWRVNTPAGLATAELPDGRIARVEDGELVFRDPGTGETVASIGAGRVSSLTVAPGGLLAYGRRSPDSGGELVVSTPDGQELWSVPLTAPDRTPVVITDAIVVVDGAVLRAYDLGGRPLWSAGRHGFRAGRALADPGTDEIVGPVLALNEGPLVFEVRWVDGSALLAVDPRAATVDRIVPPVGLHGPRVPVELAGHTPGLVTLGPSSESTAEPGRHTWRVVAVDLAGRLRWSHELSAQPRALLPAGAGHTVVVCSPTLEQWRSYHRWYDLSDQCAVRVLDAGGDAAWGWDAPGPLTARPAVGPDGTVYVAGPDRLWAIADAP